MLPKQTVPTCRDCPRQIDGVCHSLYQTVQECVLLSSRKNTTIPSLQPDQEHPNTLASRPVSLCEARNYFLPLRTITSFVHKIIWCNIWNRIRRFCFFASRLLTRTHNDMISRKRLQEYLEKLTKAIFERHQNGKSWVYEGGGQQSFLKY